MDWKQEALKILGSLQINRVEIYTLRDNQKIRIGEGCQGRGDLYLNTHLKTL